jgi:hypothetical protein
MRKRIYWISLGAFVVMNSLFIFPLWLHESRNPQFYPSAAPNLSFAIHNDSLVTGKITAVRVSYSGFPWEIDLQIESSQDVSDLANYTRDKIGQIITASTDQDVRLIKAGDYLTAHVQLATEPGSSRTFFYIHQTQ